MEYPEYCPVLDLYRSNYIDNQFFGLYYVFENGKLKTSLGKDCGAKFYLRSMLKPIQASILADDEIYDYFHFESEELAVMQASHTGEPAHTALVQSILKKIGLKEEDLLCPVIEPLNTKIYVGKNFSKLHNNCSGKHAMMLAYCVYNGFDVKNYTDFNHPVQKKIKEKFLNYAETNDFIQTKDGCTVPIYGVKIENIKKAILNYYADKKNKRLIKSFKENPYIIGGSDNSGIRTDTKISKLSPELVSKVGAGGFIYVYNLKTDFLLIVKMSQDNNLAREVVTFGLLEKFGQIKKGTIDDKIYTEAGEQIGKYRLN